MSDPCHLLAVYLHLAAASQRRRRPHVRDRLLIIAGTIAARMKLDLVAAHCRNEVLRHNPRHLIRRWPTFAAALQEHDFLVFLKQLQRRYPQEQAENMLAALDIELGNERDVYYSDLEYAASLLGVTPQQLADQYGD